MECSTHKDREAIAVCIRCGSFVCGECQVIIDRRNYCKPCVDKKFSARLSLSPAEIGVKGNSLALIALVLSALFFLPRVGMLTALTGSILGIIALNDIRKRDPQGEGASLAKWAIAVGLIGLLLHLSGMVGSTNFFHLFRFPLPWMRGFHQTSHLSRL